MSTLPARIYGLVGALLAGVAIAVAVNVVSTSRVVSATQRLGSVNLASVDLSQQIGTLFERLNSIVNSAPAEMDLERGKAQSEEFARCAEEAKQLLAKLDPLLSEPALREACAGLQNDLPVFASASGKVFKLASDFLQQQALEALQQDVAPVQERIRTAQSTITRGALDLAESAPAGIVAEAEQSRLLIIAVGIATTLICAGASIWVVRRHVVKPLRALIDDLTATSQKSSDSATALAGASQSLADGSSQQAASVEETSASLEEISSVTKQNAGNADVAQSFAGRAREAAENGASEMNEMNAAVKDIQTASDSISAIIKTIDEIAFQTNILALNAAVEAARAGEAGLGFAVVADEVRSLAKRSVEAAKETSEKITRSLQASQRGVQISGRVGARLEEIVSTARELHRLVEDITRASREQSTGITQVGTAVLQIQQITQTNASTAEETAAAAAEVHQQTAALQACIHRLQTLVEGGVPAAGPRAAAGEDAAPRRPHASARARTSSADRTEPAAATPSEPGTTPPRGTARILLHT